ncbi:hypothetical protein BHE74_00055744 [Ensete ventricosum]|nr:hypothetical protein GW17_00058626 [Ensete ventricosum]RWW38970.1 hypothetical protein BHE74_00055744 [Ensete ventricosum]RZS25027.1 hypothetical protein BHM03_00058179 [Ensete ventricosum]
MEVGESGDAAAELERRVMATLKASEERGDPPLLRAVEAARCVQEAGLGLPNPELAHVLVSNLCFANNTPSMWKLLDQAMSVIPRRWAQPEAYRLYLEFVSRYALSSLSSEAGGSRRDK